MVITYRAPFDNPNLATANAGGVTLYHYGDDSFNLIGGLNHQTEISLSLDWTLHKCVSIKIV